MSDLTATKDEITRDMLSLIDDGLPITMVDASASDNRVIVSLADRRDGDHEFLRERYGPAVVVELGAQGVPDACNGPSPYGRGNCRQMKGGLRIEPASGADCSSAFQATKANGDRVIITAGHCLQYHGGSGKPWYHNDDRFGISQGNSLSDPPSATHFTADIGWIKIDASEDISPANQWFANSSADIRSITGVRSNFGQVEGDPVCRSGEQSYFDCGVIKADDVSKPNGEGETIASVWTWDEDSAGGDSGGTMVYPIFVMPGVTAYYAAGLQVHSVEVACGDPGEPVCRSWYSTAQLSPNRASADAITS